MRLTCTAHERGVGAACSSFDGEDGFTLLAQRVADAGPKELLRGICNDGGVDEAVVCELRVIILAEGAVGIIDHGDGR